MYPVLKVIKGHVLMCIVWTLVKSNSGTWLHTVAAVVRRLIATSYTEFSHQLYIKWVFCLFF